MKMKKLTRREALKVFGVGALAAVFAKFKKVEALPEPEVVITGDDIDFDSFSDLVDGDGWTVKLEDWKDPAEVTSGAWDTTFSSPSYPAQWAWEHPKAWKPPVSIDFGFEPSDSGSCFFIYESRGAATNDWRQIAEDCKQTMGLERVVDPMLVTVFVYYDNPKKAAMTYRWDYKFVQDDNVIVTYETKAQYTRRDLEDKLEALKRKLKGEVLIA